MRICTLSRFLTVALIRFGHHLPVLLGFWFASKVVVLDLKNNEFFLFLKGVV